MIHSFSIYHLSLALFFCLFKGTHTCLTTTTSTTTDSPHSPPHFPPGTDRMTVNVVPTSVLALFMMSACVPRFPLSTTLVTGVLMSVQVSLDNANVSLCLRLTPDSQSSFRGELSVLLLCGCGKAMRGSSVHVCVNVEAPLYVNKSKLYLYYA